MHSRNLSDEELINLSKTTSSFVLLDRYIAGIKERCVTFDHQAASALATSYLIDRGHRHIVCVTGPCDRDSTKVRLAGFIQAMSEYQLVACQSHIIEGDYELDSGYDAMAAIMALPKKPSAIFSTGEEMTRGIMKYCYQHGIQCPEDISIISYDSVDSCRGLYPQVTTIEFPISRMAHEAVLLLTEQLASNVSHSKRSSIEPCIKEGQSVKEIGVLNS